MSDIIITHGNISKFTKRVQAVLQEEFAQDIPLSQAQELFSRFLGTRNFHELQEKIKFKPGQVNFVEQALLKLKNLFSENTNCLLNIKLIVSNDDLQFCFYYYCEQTTNVSVIKLGKYYLFGADEEADTALVRMLEESEPLPKHLFENIIAFCTFFQKTVDAKANTIRGAFVDWINESVYKETHPRVLLSNVKPWAVLFNNDKWIY